MTACAPMVSVTSDAESRRPEEKLINDVTSAFHVIEKVSLFISWNVHATFVPQRIDAHAFDSNEPR